MAARVVGYLEYGKALESFDRLVQLSTEEELEAIDEIVSDRNEFTVYVNLSNQMPVDERTGSLSDREGPNRRSGLAWVMALARVEFGAIVAGFTDHQHPYKYVTPNTYDFNESLELILDGVLTHYTAMEQGQVSRELTRGQAAIQKTLGYGRRIRIVQHMLKAAMMPGPTLYSLSQAKQLDSYRRNLDDTQDVLLVEIQRYLATQVHRSEWSTATHEFTNACGALLQAERRETAEGTATVRKFGDSSASQ